MGDKNSIYGGVGDASITNQIGWTELGNITVIQAALGVGARTISDVEGLATTKTVIWTVPSKINFGYVRFRTDADADAWVVEMYGVRKDDEYLDRIATLTLTGGTQEAGAAFFVDTIVATNENSEKALAEVHSADNFIARYGGDFSGWDKLIFIASTIEAAATLFIDGTGF